jgi:hypothetical protein
MTRRELVLPAPPFSSPLHKRLRQWLFVDRGHTAPVANRAAFDLLHMELTSSSDAL